MDVEDTFYPSLLRDIYRTPSVVRKVLRVGSNVSLEEKRMASDPERRRYYPDEENVPLSEAVREALQAHENSSLSADELELYDHINPEAIDTLFQDTAGIDISIQIHLTNVTVSLWSDGGVDIRVADKMG